MNADYLRKTLHRNMLEKRLQRNRHLVSGRILDIGSRDRRYDHIFEGDVVAIDIQEDPSKRIEFGDVQVGLPYADHSFDSVICIEVFEYLDKYDAALTEIHRVMRPGAIAVISVPFIDNDHEDKLRFTKSFFLSRMTLFETVACYTIGNGYTVIWDILRKKALSVRPRLLALAIILVLLPYLLLVRLFRIDQVEDGYYSGLFLVLRRELPL